MTDRMKSLRDNFMGVYRENVIPMYRFQLARCGDWSLAQEMTKAAFTAALRWFDPERQAAEQRRAWLFGIGAAVNTPRGWDGEEGEDAVPTQEQVGQFASLSALHEQWKKIPKKRLDVLALAVFAELSVTEIAQIVGEDAQTVTAWLDNLSEQPGALRALASKIMPVGYFVPRLEGELRELSQTHKRAAKPGWLWLRFAYLAGPSMTLASRVLPVVLLAGLLVLAIWSMRSQGQSRTQDDITNQINLRGNAETSAAATRGALVNGLINYPVTVDHVIVAGADSALYSIALADGSRKRILPPGSYALGPDALGFAPTVSPDGSWLSVARVKSKGTWLYALDGSRQIQISQRPVQLTWSPDGSRVAFVDPDTGQKIMIFDISEMRQQVLIWMDSPLSALSWSPDGKSIAAEMDTPQSQEGSNANTVIIKVGVVNVQKPSWLELYLVPDQPETNLIEPLLMWTANSDELWIPRFRVAVRLKDTSLRLLTAQPGSDVYNVQSLLLGYKNGNIAQGNQIFVSPDLVKLAILYKDISYGVSGTLALQLDEQSGRNLWIKQFGPIGDLAWTGEGLNLIVSEKKDEPGNLFIVDAMRGHDQMVTTNVQLLGTQSGLMNAALHRAPRVTLWQIGNLEQTGTWIVQQGFRYVYFRFPMDWKVWRPENSDGHVVLSNFDYSGPFGFASMNDEDISIEVSASMGGDPINRASLEQISKSSAPGTFRYESVIVSGVEGFRLFYSEQSGLTSEEVVVPVGSTEVHFTLTPYSEKRAQVLDKMLQSVRIDLTARNGTTEQTPVN